MFSFVREPTRFNFVYIDRNVGRASVGGSFGFAWARICSGTTELEFWSCERILAGKKPESELVHSMSTSSSPFEADVRIVTWSLRRRKRVDGNS